MTVFANGREVAGKKTSNKSVASAPDVCLSPPPPPAGPLPCPYLLVASAGDTDGGTTTVFILGKPVMMKNSSEYKSSKGDEPATRSFGQGVVTHTLSSVLKFVAWSFDVFFQGKNACRLMDMTSANKKNSGNLTTSLGKSGSSKVDESECDALHKKNSEDREFLGQSGNSDAAKECANKGTITHFNARVGNEGFFGKARSRELASCYDNGCNPVKGIERQYDVVNGKKKIKKNHPSNICGGGKHTYKNATGRPDSSHTEARILEEISQKFANEIKGGVRPQVVMAIDWKTARDPSKGNSPCKACQAAICVASECMDVVICDGANTEQKTGKSYC